MLREMQKVLEQLGTSGEQLLGLQTQFFQAPKQGLHV